MNADPKPITEDAVREVLQKVIDPEVGMSVVDLGLVYGIDVSQQRIHVRMTMTSPACPLADSITESARNEIGAIAPGDAAIDIEIVWDPPWTPDMMSELARGRFGWPGS
jgi:metal-sulfur cluster biosynthetic enzyme